MFKKLFGGGGGNAPAPK
jgi:hypothetical protein